MRKLTGKWYLKKRLFGYVVMIETKQKTFCDLDFSISPEFTIWEKANKSDLKQLNIKLNK